MKKKPNVYEKVLSPKKQPSNYDKKSSLNSTAGPDRASG